MAAITLPPIPPQPAADATPAVWDVYLRILALYSAAAGQDSAAKTQDAINAQTAQMVKMTAAAERSATLMQQLLDQPAPAPAAGDSARVAMAALMTEGGSEKPPAEVAQAVLARVAAVDTMLGG